MNLIQNNMKKEDKALVSPESALDFVEKELHIKIKGNRRKTNDLVFARTIFYYICREHLGLSSMKTGAMVQKDHATVLHSMSNILPQLKRINPYAKLLLKIDKIFEFDGDVRKVDVYFEQMLQKNADKLKELDVYEENRILKQKVIDLEHKLNLIPKNREIFELLERIPKRKKEEAEERMVRSLRLVYNA